MEKEHKVPGEPPHNASLIVKITVISHFITCLHKSTEKAIQAPHAGECWNMHRSLYFCLFVSKAFSSHQRLGFNNVLTFPERLLSPLFHKLQLCVCGSGRVTVSRSPIQLTVTTATTFSCTARTREKLDSYIDFPSHRHPRACRDQQVEDTEEICGHIKLCSRHSQSFTVHLLSFLSLSISNQIKVFPI